MKPSPSSGSLNSNSGTDSPRAQSNGGGMAGPPGLGGLFAGGMPKLRPAGAPRPATGGKRCDVGRGLYIDLILIGPVFRFLETFFLVLSLVE